MISITVNGEKRQIEAWPETPLLYILRGDFGLMGAKFACGLEQCGACKVIVDGRAIPSCKIAVKDLDGHEITTVEHLSRNGTLHAVQQAFIDEQAMQCGFCTAGFIAAAAALLDRNPHPTEGDIRRELKYHLCRCGVYPRVLRAVKRAAGILDGPPAITVLDRPLKMQTETPGALPASLERVPELDRWLQINVDGTITLFAGKVEYGQGILTAFAQLAAEELDVSVARMAVMPAQTGRTPNEGMTVGSMSLMSTGNAVRHAAAEARAYLISLAYEELEAQIADLVVKDGLITDISSGRSVSYWDLMGGKSFGRNVTGAVPLKPFETYELVGQAVKRLDLHAKVTGAPAFVHDIAFPGMLHGRVLKPPAPGAALVAFDPTPIEALPGVARLVRDGSFLGVIAETEAQAAFVLEAMKKSAAWHNPNGLLGGEDQAAHLGSLPHRSFHIVNGTPADGPVPEAVVPEDAATIVSGEYFRPFQLHAALGPSAAVAHMQGGELTLWMHAQGVYPIRGTIAHVLGLDEDRITVIHREGPGCYGHSGSDDAALDAALLAQAHPGAPISVKWTREDEFRWEPNAPAMSVRMMGGLDSQGRIVNWDHQVRSYPHFGRARLDGTTSGLLSAWYLEEPFEAPVPVPSQWPHAGGYRNADPLYRLPNKRVVKHYVQDRPLRTSSMRGLGAFANVFAIESFMDELAYAAGKDPAAFRLDYLEDDRAREVIQAAVDHSGWRVRNAPRGDGTGQGIAFARYKNSAAYCAVVMQVEIDPETRKIRLLKALITADAGHIVNPDGLSNQLEGGLVQAASWTLKEQTRYNAEGIQSCDWYSYPILLFNEAPEIRTVLLNRPGAPFLGAGEASSGPTGAAIANAVFDATGVRLRKLPLALP